MLQLTPVNHELEQESIVNDGVDGFFDRQVLAHDVIYWYEQLGAQGDLPLSESRKVAQEFYKYAGETYLLGIRTLTAIVELRNGDSDLTLKQLMRVTAARYALSRLVASLVFPGEEYIDPSKDVITDERIAASLMLDSQDPLIASGETNAHAIVIPKDNLVARATLGQDLQDGSEQWAKDASGLYVRITNPAVVSPAAQAQLGYVKGGEAAAEAILAESVGVYPHPGAGLVTPVEITVIQD